MKLLIYTFLLIVIPIICLKIIFKFFSDITSKFFESPKESTSQEHEKNKQKEFTIKEKESHINTVILNTCKTRVRDNGISTEQNVTNHIKKGIKNAQNNNCDILFLRGHSHYHNGNLDDAITDFKKSIELKQNNADAYFYLGNAYDKKGDKTLALHNYQKAIDIKSKYVKRIKKEYKDVLQEQNKQTCYVIDIHDARLKNGYYDDEIQLCNKELEKYPNDTAILFRRGNAYLNKGNPDIAILDYDKIITLVPKNDVAYVCRGIAYRNIGDYNSACRDFRKAIKLNPGFEYDNFAKNIYPQTKQK